MTSRATTSQMRSIMYLLINAQSANYASVISRILQSTLVDLRDVVDQYKLDSKHVPTFQRSAQALIRRLLYDDKIIVGATSPILALIEIQTTPCFTRLRLMI